MLVCSGDQVKHYCPGDIIILDSCNAIGLIVGNYVPDDQHIYVYDILITSVEGQVRLERVRISNRLTPVALHNC